MDNIDVLFETASRMASFNKSFSIATIVATGGRTPRKEGRMLILPDGSTCGTVGGGTAERDVIACAMDAMAEGRSRRVQIKVRDCGMLDVYIDVPLRGRKAVIFGTGHIAKALSEVLFKIGFQINFVDSLAAEHGFECPVGMSLSPSLKGVALDSKTAVIISNPEDRDKVIEALLASPCPYIGVLSSKSRPAIANSRIFQPIGLDIGAETPEEIAISIAAQILGIMNGKT